MKTIIDAARTLLNAGWSTKEIKSILGNISDLKGSEDDTPNTPWWSLLDEDNYANGASIVTEWTAWVEHSK